MRTVLGVATSKVHNIAFRYGVTMGPLVAEQIARAVLELNEGEQYFGEAVSLRLWEDEPDARAGIRERVARKLFSALADQHLLPVSAPVESVYGDDFGTMWVRLTVPVRRPL